MLSPEQCRKVDPELDILTDDELLEIRDQLYAMGQLIFDDWLTNGSGSKYPAGVLRKLQESNTIKLCPNENQKME